MKNATFCLDVLLLCLCLSACFCEASSFKRILYKQCTKEQRIIEAESWAGAHMLAEATNLWVPKEYYQEAADMYMGTGSSWDGLWYLPGLGPLIAPNFRKIIQS